MHPSWGTYPDTTLRFPEAGLSIAIAATGTLAVIRGKGQPRKSKHFTTTEDGLIGGLNAMGASDTMIAEVLERSESSIKQRKKLIGLN